MTDTLDTIRRAICREICAFYGDKPCYEVVGQHAFNDPEFPKIEWPNPHCDEPGCDAQARAVFAALEGKLK